MKLWQHVRLVIRKHQNRKQNISKSTRENAMLFSRLKTAHFGPFDICLEEKAETFVQISVKLFAS